MEAPEPSPMLAPKLNPSQLKLLLNIFITFLEIDIISDKTSSSSSSNLSTSL